MIIGKTFKIDGAHFLPRYDGKCRRMHGHTWTITVEVHGDIQEYGPNEGMVMDLNQLSKAVHAIIDKWDHQVVNDFLKVPPTCENVSMIIALDLKEMLPRGVHVHSVSVQEGDGGYAKCCA